MLGHQAQVEQREVLRVGVLHRHELSQYVLGVGAESGVQRDGHEALEALEQDGVGRVFDVPATGLRADAVVRGD